MYVVGITTRKRKVPVSGKESATFGLRNPHFLVSLVKVDTEPMQVASQFKQATVEVKSLKLQLSDAQKTLARLELQMLDLMESGKLPESFRFDGASIHTRNEIWASPKDGDHQALVAALRAEELHEYLPRNVNGQSISAYVREHYNAETDSFVGLPPNVEAALNITKKVRCIATGAK